MQQDVRYAGSHAVRHLRRLPLLLLSQIPSTVHSINFLPHMLLWLFKSLGLWNLQHHVSLRCICEGTCGYI